MARVSTANAAPQCVRVAIVDSGITAGHPHVGAVAGGIAFHLLPSGAIASDDDFRDRHGHGTACAGVIRELLPQADILAVKIFDRELAAHSELLARGIEWSIEAGAHVVSLSLVVMPVALPRSPERTLLVKAARRARQAHVILAAALPREELHRESGPLASAGGALLCMADASCPPDQLFRLRGRRRVFMACPYARAIPGLDPRRNFHGASLAAARLAGFAGRAIERGEKPVRIESVRSELASIARSKLLV